MSYHFWDEVLKFVEALTKWPPIALAIALLFRNRLSSLKFKGKDLELEVELREAITTFRRLVAESDPDLVNKVAPFLLADILTDLPGKRQAKGDSEILGTEKPGGEAEKDGVDEGDTVADVPAETDTGGVDENPTESSDVQKLTITGE